MITGIESSFKYINLLNEKDFNELCCGVNTILLKTGVTVKDGNLREIMSNYGCGVDDLNERVFFPESVINKALADVPKGFSVKGKSPENDITFEPDKATLFLNGCGKSLYDDKTQTVREPSRKEFYEYIYILEKLPNIDIQNCFPFFGFAKVPECMKLIESAAAKIRMSSKVQIEGSVYDNYIFIKALAEAADVEIMQIVNSAAPLTYFEETTEQLSLFAENDIPFHLAAGPTRGLTSPMSAVGSVIANNAEALAGIIMAQAIRPGARVWVNSMILTPDMRTLSPAFGDIGNSVTDGIFNQYWRHCRIPCWSNAASWTSSKTIDYQAGYEMIMALMSQALSGSTAISFQGGLNAELSVSPLKAVIDDDIVGMVKRFLTGPDVSVIQESIDLISEIGPVPGSFMNTEMTLMNWQGECYIPAVAGREGYEEWNSSGRKDILKNAKIKLQELLSGNRTGILDKNIEDSIETVLQEARKYYRKKGLISDEEWRIYLEDLSSENYPYA